MAEAALFSLAGKLLAEIATPAFKKAYDRAQSIYGATDELDKLKNTIETIHAVLIDADKKQESSDAVKKWIKRVRDVLYEADDLFDEVATNDLLQQQIQGNKLWKKVQVSFSPLNPILSKDSFAKKVKVIRKSLDQISTDMNQFSFVQQFEGPISGIRRGQDQGSFVDPSEVFGRDDDKKAILKFVFDESNAEGNISVIAIVGIGGMGKTTLAQLVYNDEEVQQKFEKRTWWACISDISDEKDVLGKIFQSITEENYQNLNMRQLESGIRDSISENKKFLLVIDNVWDDSRDRWLKRMSLFSGVAKGSKIIVTTRESGVARAMGAVVTHELRGLSEDKSWELFRRVAFTGEQKVVGYLGREILKKCANVPLAIRSIGSLLYGKTTIQEWETFKDSELSKIALSDNPTIAALKLSYDLLNSNLKNCFAYCSLFPKDYRIDKDELICLWISQGYVDVESSNVSQTLEDVGHMYFMELLRMSFFQEVVRRSNGEIWICKMHDLLHDLAEHVAGEETARLNTQTDKFTGPIRHLAIENEVDASKMSLLSLPNLNQLRSLLNFVWSSADLSIPDKLFTKFRCLRALDLSGQRIEKVSSSIGELIHLRYLNLSLNKFKDLPDSITRLLNLRTLNISWCGGLESLPNDFRKLINLRHLYNESRSCLRYMPPGFEQLTSLRCLSCFKVGKVTDGGKSSRPDALAGLELRGRLRIEYESDMAPGVGESTPVERLSNFKVGKCCGLDAFPRLKIRGEMKTEYKNDNYDCYEDEISQLVLEKLEVLELSDYPGMRIRSLPTNLVELRLVGCRRVKHLPSFRCFPFLKSLNLAKMDELEYVDEDEEKNIGVIGAATGSNPLFFPCLETLELWEFPKLKGWSSKKGIAVEQQEEVGEHSSSTCSRPPPPSYHMPSFPRLIKLNINDCPELQSMPLSPRLQTLVLQKMKECDVIVQFLISTCSDPSTSTAPSSSLEDVFIASCHGLLNFPGEGLTSLRSLYIRKCDKLKNVKLAPASRVEKLRIEDCPELERLTFLQQLVSLQCSNPSSSSITATLSSLEQIEINECDILVSIEGECLTSLRRLEISGCNQLKKVYLPPTHHKVLEELELWDCPELELGDWDWDSLSSLHHLTLISMRELELLDIKALTSLRRLQISGCNQLKKVYLPPAHHKVLEKLELLGCPELELGDWDSLSSLRQLTLRCTGELEVLDIKALTSLRDLQIYDCHQLKKVYLPPAHHKVLEELRLGMCLELELGDWDWDSLSSLHHLSLGSMRELELLDIKALTSLRRLEISHCNQLKIVYLPPTLKHLEIWRGASIGIPSPTSGN